MKRILTLMMAIAMLACACLAFTACGDDKAEYIGTYSLTSISVSDESKGNAYAATFNEDNVSALEIALRIEDEDITLVYTLFGLEKTNVLGSEWSVEDGKIVVGDYLDIEVDGDTLTFEHDWYLVAGIDPIKTTMTFTKAK